MVTAPKYPRTVAAFVALARKAGRRVDRLELREETVYERGGVAIDWCPLCHEGSIVVRDMKGGGVYARCGACHSMGDELAAELVLVIEQQSNGDARPSSRSRSEPSPIPPLRIVPLDEFADEDEPGAAAIVGSEESALITEGGSAMDYGDGGAGKTTLMIDLGFHIAAGDDWLGIPIPRPRRVLFIENEGARPRLRKKLRRKRDAWQGSPLGDRVHVYDRPWAQFSFADEQKRQELADEIRALEIDVVFAGPVTAIGMNEAGTLQQTREFDALLDEVRRRADRPVAFILTHHENRAGKVSGAWEAVGDTLIHVTGQGHGKTRVYVQKARWASEHQGRTIQLVWTAGEGFAVDETPELSDDDIRKMIVGAIREHPGGGWTLIKEQTPGVSDTRRSRHRDDLLGEREIVNVVKVDGQDVASFEPPGQGKRFCLYLVDDPAINHLVLETSSGPEEVRKKSSSPRGADGDGQLLPAALTLREEAAGEEVSAPPPTRNVLQPLEQSAADEVAANNSPHSGASGHEPTLDEVLTGSDADAWLAEHDLYPDEVDE